MRKQIFIFLIVSFTLLWVNLECVYGQIEFVTKWGSQGTGDGQFNYPGFVAVDADGYVYVADTYNHRIQKFDSKGTFITKWGSYGSGDGQFNNPDGVALDESAPIQRYLSRVLQPYSLGRLPCSIYFFRYPDTGHIIQQLFLRRNINIRGKKEIECVPVRHDKSRVLTTGRVHANSQRNRIFEQVGV